MPNVFDEAESKLSVFDEAEAKLGKKRTGATGTWAPPQAGPQEPGLLEKAASVPWKVLDRVGTNVKGIGSLVTAGGWRDMLVGMRDNFAEKSVEAESHAREGRGDQALASDIFALPLVGPLVEEHARAIQEGRWEDFAGNAIGDLATAGLSKLGPKALGKTVDGGNKAARSAAAAVTKPAVWAAEKISTGNLPKHEAFRKFGANPGNALRRVKYTTKAEIPAALEGLMQKLEPGIEVVLNRPSAAKQKIQLAPAVRAAFNDKINTLLKTDNADGAARLANVRDIILEEIESLSVGTGELTPWQAHGLKREIGNRVKFTENPALASLPDALMDTYRAADHLIDNAVPEAKRLNDLYRDAITAKKMANVALGRDHMTDMDVFTPFRGTSNTGVTPAVIGAATGNPLIAAAGAAQYAATRTPLRNALARGLSSLAGDDVPIPSKVTPEQLRAARGPAVYDPSGELIGYDGTALPHELEAMAGDMGHRPVTRLGDGPGSNSLMPGSALMGQDYGAAPLATRDLTYENGRAFGADGRSAPVAPTGLGAVELPRNYDPAAAQRIYPQDMMTGAPTIPMDPTRPMGAADLGYLGAISDRQSYIKSLLYGHGDSAPAPKPLSQPAIPSGWDPSGEPGLVPTAGSQEPRLNYSQDMAPAPMQYMDYEAAYNNFLNVARQALEQRRITPQQYMDALKSWSAQGMAPR